MPMTEINRPSPEPYEPEPGYHWASEGPAWCENLDPHRPGQCSAILGFVETPTHRLAVLVQNGAPHVVAVMPPGKGEAELTSANARELGALLDRSADMADEAATYLLH